MPSRESDARRLTAKERHAEVLRLKRAGFTLSQIAAATGYSNKGTVSAIVSKHLKDVGEELRADADHLRALEAERYDVLQRSLWPKALAGDTDAVRTVMRVSEGRRKLLGLDAPVEFQMRLDTEQVDYLEATLRRVLDAVHTALVQTGVPQVEEAVNDVWPTIMGEVVVGELVAAAQAADPDAVGAVS